MNSIKELLNDANNKKEEPTTLKGEPNIKVIKNNLFDEEKIIKSKGNNSVINNKEEKRNFFQRSKCSSNFFSLKIGKTIVLSSPIYSLGSSS